MVDKICPVCKNRTLQETQLEYEQNNKYKKSKNAALNYLTSLSEFKIDICPLCKYCAPNFENFVEEEKQVVLSKSFETLKHSPLSYMEGTISTTYQMPLYCAFIAEHCKNHFLASVCYFKASADVLNDLYEWQNEMVDSETMCLSPQVEEFSKNCEEYAAKLQAKSYVLIKKAIKTEPNNVDYRIFAAHVYCVLNKVKEMQKTIDYTLKNLSPNKIQISTLKLIAEPDAT